MSSMPQQLRGLKYFEWIDAGQVCKALLDAADRIEELEILASKMLHSCHYHDYEEDIMGEILAEARRLEVDS